MPGPTLAPFEPDTQMPRDSDVVVIGGGIIGAMTALELAERGLDVTLCEKGDIGAEQSSRNWGWVRVARRDPREIPLMCVSQNLWADMDRRVGRATGYTRSGILYPAFDDKTYARCEAWLRQLGADAPPASMVSGGELDRLLPGHQLKMKGALFTPEDGRAEPQVVAPAIAAAARKAGAKVITKCAVRTVETDAGKVSRVVTERGAIRCRHVVLAGGAWSRLFAGNAGLELPQLKVLSTAMRTTPVDDGPEAATWGKGFALRKRADGGYTVAAAGSSIVDLTPDHLRLARKFWPALKAEWSELSFRISKVSLAEARMPRFWDGDSRTPFEQNRILDPVPSFRDHTRAWQTARAAFPVLQQAEIAQVWGGMIDVTPDALPVISKVETLPGFFIATGFSGHGFGIAPGAGRLMADLITETAPVVDPTPFSFARFSTGAVLRPYEGV